MVVVVVLAALVVGVGLVGASVVLLNGGDEVPVVEAVSTTSSAAPPIRSSTTMPPTTTVVPTTAALATTTTTASTTTVLPAVAVRPIYVVEHDPTNQNVQWLSTMNPDGSNRRRLAQGSFRSPEVSRDGAWLAVTLWSEQGNKLATINADGTSLRVIADDGSWYSPTISPDGTEIVAVQFAQGAAPRLVRMRRDGSARAVLDPPDDFSGNNQVDWSPDGRRLAITDPSSQSLSVFDLATGTVQHIRPRPGTVSSPEWSPDGSRIAFSDGSQILLIAAGGGPDTIVTRGAGGVTWHGPNDLVFDWGSSLFKVNADGSGLAEIATYCRAPAV